MAKTKYMKSDLETYFKNNKKRIIHKWLHYFDIYEKHFSRFRNKEVVILEIGVFYGGSLQMWKHYFPKAKIYGIDTNPECKEYEEENIEIFIGSQANKRFLKEIKETISKVDILIDDGGHRMNEQIVTFEEMFDHIKDDGIYVCEDVNTSYLSRYGGGYKNPNTFIEYIKNVIDYLNAYHSEEETLEVNKYTKNINSIHFYDAMVIIEKMIREKPYHKMIGTKTEL